MMTERETYEARYGEVWNTKELQRDFIVHSFLAPCVIVTKRETGEKGCLWFSDYPRYYHSWAKTEIIDQNY